MSAQAVLRGAAPIDHVAIVRRDIRRHLGAAVLLAAILVFGVGSWSVLTEISGAVIAPGQLVVESDVKKVQHPTGGVVGELLVREGSRVRAGDVVVRLDETQTRANLEIVRKSMDELAARRARDEAERSGAPEVVFPDDLLARSRTDPDIARLIEGESRLFESRLDGRNGQKSQLRERIQQLRQETAGLTGQEAAKRREIALIGTELAGVRSLYEKNLVALPRVTALERDAARLEGEQGQLVASMASLRGKIAEIELQILQLDVELRTETGKDLADIRGKWAELGEKKVAAEDQLKRVDLRAPQDGTVHQMTVHTVGGLVTPSEPVMLIVPHEDQLVVDVRVQPQDIDNVRTGQTVTLRFPAFNARITPEIDGHVQRVSADVTQDSKTGVPFYLTRIAIAPDQAERLGGVRLVPGMPVEAFFQLGNRSVFSYLMKPLTDQLAKAWRER